MASALNLKIAKSKPFKWNSVLDGVNTNTMDTTMRTASALVSSSPTTCIRSIKDYILTLDSCLVIVENHNINESFNSYKQSSLNALTSGDMYSKYSIFAVNNILFLDRARCLPSQMRTFFPSSALTAFRQQQQQVYKSIKKASPSEKREQVEEILDEFAEEQDLMKTRKKLNALNDDVQDEDTFRIINFVSSLIYKVTPKDCPASENKLTTSFVHHLMLAICTIDVEQTNTDTYCL